MANKSLNLFYDLDLRIWTTTLGGSVEQGPISNLIQGDIVTLNVKFVQSGAAITLTAPVFTASSIKAQNDFTGAYLIQLAAPTGSPPLYVFTVTPLNSANLNTFLQTYRNTWCNLEIYDSANGILTTPLELQIVPGYSLSGTPTDNVAGVLSVAAGKTVTFPLSLTFPIAAGSNGQQLTTDGAGTLTWAASGSSGITLNSTTTNGFTAGRILYSDGSVVQQYAISGTGSVAMTISPTFTTVNGYAISAIASGSGAGAYITSATGTAALIGGDSGAGADISSFSGTGAFIYSTSGNHLNLGSGKVIVANNGDIILTGTSSGTTTLADANTSANNFTATIPAVTGTVAVATASATATHALFATDTHGAPAYRAIIAGDISNFTSTAAQTYTFPTTTATLARTDAAQTFTGDSNMFRSATDAGVTLIAKGATTPGASTGDLQQWVDGDGNIVARVYGGTVSGFYKGAINSGGLVFNDNEIFASKANANDGLYFNYRGYNGGTTQYRDCYFYNAGGGAATALIATFTGSTKAARFYGAVQCDTTLAVTGATTATAGIIYGTYTVGTFPTTTYLEAVVTDSLVPVQGATVAAGGSAKCKVMYNGSAKIVTAVL